MEEFSHSLSSDGVNERGTDFECPNVLGFDLDECRVLEHYQTRVPLLEPLNAKKRKRPVALDSRPWLVANVLKGPDVVESCLISEAAGGSW